MGMAGADVEGIAVRIQLQLQLEILKMDAQNGSLAGAGRKRVKFSGLPRQEYVANHSDYKEFVCMPE